MPTLALKAHRSEKDVRREPTRAVGCRGPIARRRGQGLNKILMVGHSFLFSLQVRELRRRLAEGELESIYYSYSEGLNLGLYRPDVNVVWDLAPHDITIANYLLQDVPTAVSVWGRPLQELG